MKTITSNLIEEDFKKAFKNKEDLKISTLRLLKNSIHNLEIEKKRPLSSEEIWQAVNKEIKQREEAISQYKKGKREDLAKQEKKEIEILSAYLPPQLSPEEIKKLAKEVILKTKASCLADLGKVMKEIMPKVKGRVEGCKVAEIVKKELEKL